MQRFWRPETGIFLGFWLAMMTVGQSRLFRDPGTFWHTHMGEQMLASGQLIHSDTFSFTFGGTPWIPHQWLGECLMAILHRLGGLDALLLAIITVLAATYTWMASRMIRAGLHWTATVFLMILVVGASSHHFHVRPHIATIAFVGLTYAFLCDFEAGRIGVGRLAWLIPIYIFWSSVHGGMLAGLVLMVLALAGWLVYPLLVRCLGPRAGASVLGRESPIRSLREGIWLPVIIIACGLTALINPYGVELPIVWWTIMVDSPILPQIIQEHAPLRLWDQAGVKAEGWIVLIVAGTYLVVLAGTLPRWPRVTWLLPLALFYVSLGRIRHAPLFAITAGLAIAEMFPHTRWAAMLVKAGSGFYRRQDESDRTRRPWDWRPLVIPAIVVASALFLDAARIPAPVIGSSWAQPDRSVWPDAEVAVKLKDIHDHCPDGTPIFNDLVYGGYIMYGLPKFRVFVDDRCELYGDQWLLQYVQAEETGSATQMQKWQERYHFKLALVPAYSRFNDYFRSAPGWKVAAEGPTSVLYERITSSVPQ